MSNDYDTVTTHDIAEFLHHLAELHRSPDGADPAQRAAFLAHKAELFTRIATQSAHSHPDAYSQQVQQIATDARAAADHARLQLPQQRMGPNHKRTSDAEPDTDGPKSQEQTGASSA